MITIRYETLLLALSSALREQRERDDKWGIKSASAATLSSLIKKINRGDVIEVV